MPLQTTCSQIALSSLVNSTDASSGMNEVTSGPILTTVSLSLHDTNAASKKCDRAGDQFRFADRAAEIFSGHPVLDRQLERTSAQAAVEDQKGIPRLPGGVPYFKRHE